MHFKTRYLFLVVVMISMVVPGTGQNLLKNPSFESLTRWDEFWDFSTIAPSSASAVATEITAEAHDGMKCVELSNEVANKWTFLYSDNVNAPLKFEARQRYEVKGWIKSVEEGKNVILSVYWNDSQEHLIFYSGNPDPVTNPDWFMVADTLTASADFVDGYLSLGFRAGKDGPMVSGNLLVDDFSVIRLPSVETDITSFFLAEQTGPATIDNVFHTVIVEVADGTDLTSIAPTIRLSPSASITPVSGVATNFSSPKIYTVTAEDGLTKQDYIVVVNTSPFSNETDIVSFAIANEVDPAVIDKLNHTVSLIVPFGTDVTALVPTIGLSAGATVAPGNRVPGDFTSPLTYTVTAEDGVTTRDWKVTVFVQLNDQTDIESFSILEEAGPAVIDKLDHTVSLIVPFGTDVTALAPTIGLSAGATIAPGNKVPGDFTSPLTYTVTAEDGVTTGDWKVTVFAQLNDQTDIESFSIPEEAGPAVIDKLDHTVSLEVPFGTNVTALVPTIGLSDGATIASGNRVPGDFTSPVTYIVIAEDGVTTQDWTVSVVVLLNDQTDIESFSIPEEAGPAVIDKLNHTVFLLVEKGTELSALVPTIELSEGASIEPGNGLVTDFTAPVEYRVTAGDGVTFQIWKVSVTTDQTVDVNRALILKRVIVYPNPARDFITIELTEISEISLVDMTGRVVFTVSDVSESLHIPLGDLNRGVYLIQVKWIDSRQVFRVLLE